MDSGLEAMFMKDLLIVTADSLNIIDVFQETMDSFTGLTFNCLDNDTTQRTYNFFLKSLAGQNLKHFYHNSSIETEPGNECTDKEFFQLSFRELPDAVKNKYHIKQWLANVLNIESAIAA